MNGAQTWLNRSLKPNSFQTFWNRFVVPYGSAKPLDSLQVPAGSNILEHLIYGHSAEMDHHNCGPEYCVESCIIWLHPKGRIYALPVPPSLSGNRNLQAWGVPFLYNFFGNCLSVSMKVKYIISRRPASGIMEDDVLRLFCTRAGFKTDYPPLNPLPMI